MEAATKTQLLHYKDYVAGWLDSSVHDSLEVLLGGSASTAFALITCLDSNLDPKSLLAGNAGLQSALKRAKPLGKGLLLPSRLLLDAALRDQLFFGFDEVWFFPSDRVAPKPESAWIVGPKRVDQTKLDRLGPWMSDAGCSLALGDGAGLNVIVKARGLVRRLIANSLSQPAPAVQTNGFVREDTGEE